MIPQGQINRILVAQIDFSDLEFRLSPLALEREAPALAESIGRVGLLHPPILRKTGDRYQLVSGHHRAWVAARQGGMNAVPGLVLPVECDKQAALGLALEALVCKRPPSPMELALFCRKMLVYLKAGEIANLFLPRLGLTPTPFLVDQAARLSELEEPFAVALHQGSLQEATARELLNFSLPERLALFELIDLLHLSAGNQRKLVEICRELSRREKISPLRLLGGEEIGRILDHPGMNIPQKSAALLRYLVERRSPQLSTATAEFAEFQRSLSLPEPWSISPTLSFEDERLTLHIPLAHREELRRRLPDLLAAAGFGDWPAAPSQSGDQVESTT